MAPGCGVSSRKDHVKALPHLDNSIACVTIGPFYMVVLVGYSIAGICIVVVGRSRRMLGCLGNLVMCQVPATTVAI